MPSPFGWTTKQYRSGELSRAVPGNAYRSGDLSHAAPGKEGKTEEIRFTVEGLPQGKGRPRSTAVRKKPYTPAKTLAYENHVRNAFLMAYFEALGKPMAGEDALFGAEIIEAKVVAYYPMPKRVSRIAERMMSLGIARPTRRPDADNIAKSVLDALNRLAYNDDSQVAELSVSKLYCRAGEERVEIVIRPLHKG